MTEDICSDCIEPIRHRLVNPFSPSRPSSAVDLPTSGMPITTAPSSSRSTSPASTSSPSPSLPSPCSFTTSPFLSLAFTNPFAEDFRNALRPTPRTSMYTTATFRTDPPRRAVACPASAPYLCLHISRLHMSRTHPAAEEAAAVDELMITCVVASRLVSTTSPARSSRLKKGRLLDARVGWTGREPRRGASWIATASEGRLPLYVGG